MPPPSESTGIQACVDRLLASPGFRIPARRARLLRYLADRAADGQGEQINEYAIGVDVFERPPSFDPKTDAVVRAEVSRLRQNLKDYYSANGSTEGLELPARSYVPVFRTRPIEGAARNGQGRSGRRRRVWIWPAMGAVCMLAALVAWRWLVPKTPDPPQFSLAVLPATVTPAAADFTDRADAFSQELMSSLNRTRGLSILGWMKVSGLRGANAVKEARLGLPVALFLETQIDRAQGALEAHFRLYGRKGVQAIWSAAAPLGNCGDLASCARTLANAHLSPVLERDFNIVAYRRATGATRIQPTFAGLEVPKNPCAAKPRLFASLGRPDAEVTVGAQAMDARSPDARIEMFADGRRVYPLQTIHTKAGAPISLRAPALVQLAEDTCVLSSASGDAPVYDGNCIVAPPGRSDVRLMYACAAKTLPIDISRLTNDSQSWNEETLPAGPRILAGIPFLIPEGVNRSWDATAGMQGARPVTLTIPVKQLGVSRAFFLMNTIWGQPGPASYLAVTFTGDRGARFEKKLIGGVDVRDYNRGVYTNAIDGGSSRVAFDNGLGQRMDLVEVDLPLEFRRQTLEAITIVDTGRYSFQRAMLWGVSAQ